MYNVETVESLVAYGYRLHNEAVRPCPRRSSRRAEARQLLRKVRRSA